MSDDNIIPLRPGASPEEFRVSSSSCSHFQGCFVDERTRQVTCRDCGALLDPFDRLLRIAKDAERKVEQAKNWRAEVNALVKRAEMLKRLERNARARLGRLGVDVHNDTKWRQGNWPNTPPLGEFVVASVRGIPLGHIHVETDPPMDMNTEQAQALCQALGGALSELFAAKRKADKNAE